MALLAVPLIAWILAAVPDFAGQAKGERTLVGRVFSVPGVLPVVIVTLLYVMAHNVLYTYIASFLAPVGMSDSVSAVLLVFGVASLVSIWITGLRIDRHLRTLMMPARPSSPWQFSPSECCQPCPRPSLSAPACGASPSAELQACFRPPLQTRPRTRRGSCPVRHGDRMEHRHRRRRDNRRAPAQRIRFLFPGMGNLRATHSSTHHRHRPASTPSPPKCPCRAVVGSRTVAPAAACVRHKRAPDGGEPICRTSAARTLPVSWAAPPAVRASARRGHRGLQRRCSWCIRAG